MDLQHITDRDAILQTRKWITDVVIGLNFCPFAAKSYHSERIRYRVLRDHGLQGLLETCMEEALFLDRHAEVETTLMLLMARPLDFEAFLDNLELCEALLSDQGYDGVYQLASFHPEYRFEDTAPDDPGNYTNRSPYPMLHFLRESSITQAVDHYPDVDAIPERNRKKARELGLRSMETLRQACLDTPLRGSE